MLDFLGWEHMSSFCVGSAITAALVRVFASKLIDTIYKIPESLIQIQKDIVAIQVKLEALDKMHAQVLDHDRKLSVIEAKFNGPSNKQYRRPVETVGA